MALHYNGDKAFPTYIAVSSDISGSKITGASKIGATVYITDTQKWYIVSGSTLLLEAFVMPALEI
jgi:hypothetical protein